MKRLQQDRGFSRYSLLLLWFLIAATGCASLQRQPLDVLLSDLELLPAQGLAPRFSISMQLINPNNSQIAIEYQLEVTLHESNRFIPIRLQRDGVVNLSDI